MAVRDGTDHHGDVLDYLEGEKLCCGVLVLKMSGKGGDVREKRRKAKETQQEAQTE
jgi:hypothetical protein